MDIDQIDKKVQQLMAFKDRAEPMLKMWEEHMARERIGAEPIPPTEAELDKAAARVRGYAEAIHEIAHRPLG